MVETAILIVFAATLVTGTVLGVALPLLLIFGTLLFSGYGLWRGFRPGELARMAASGLKTVGPVLILFAIIGMLTASWRASGAISLITCLSINLAHPSTLVVASFLINCAMSFLIGSSFGAAATTGIVCMVVGNAMGANPLLMGGAIISGTFFGDRCSPMSSSASLVATITHTEVSDNLERMMRTGIVPFALSILFYAVAGSLTGSGPVIRPHFVISFRQTFDLGWVVLAPVLVTLVLSLAHVSVRKTMIASLLTALGICVFVQGMPVEQIPSLLVWGFHSGNEAIANMTDGGGIVSMAELVVVVGVASTYSGLFEGTGLLTKLRATIEGIARKTTPYLGVLLTAIVTCLISCDQVVSTMLTAQLCNGCETSGKALALDIENSSIVVAALVPWSTSVIGILAFIGAPVACTPFAVFAILVPAWTLVLSMCERKNPGFVDSKHGRMMGLREYDDVRRMLA